MKTIISRALTAVLTLSLLVGSGSALDATEKNQYRTDFEKDNSGFSPFFADYPNTDDIEEFYELTASRKEIPIPGAGYGLYISGNNHSDDLFMGYVKQFEGLVPHQEYLFTIQFKLATNVEKGMIGVGGSPGEGVTVKCGVTDEKPELYLDKINHFRTNIQKGGQTSSGFDMYRVGTLAKQNGQFTDEYEFNTYSLEFVSDTNDMGTAYLIIGTDSGFEATTSYYLDDIVVSWEVANPAIQRREAAKLLYLSDSSAYISHQECSFTDVPADSAYKDAIVWCAENGIVAGYGANVFGYKNALTVQEAMLMLYRAHGSPATDRTILNNFSDRALVPTWAEDAIAWALSNHIIERTNFISSASKMSRAEFADALEKMTLLEEESEYYWCTTKSKAEVEQFASQIRELVLSQNWDELSKEIIYPITIDSKTYNNAAAFVDGDVSSIIDDAFYREIKAEDCIDMLCRADGIMLGTGQIWISEKDGALKIISFNLG